MVEVRREVLDLIEAGRPVVEIAEQLGVSDQTNYYWRNQDHVDRGLRSGVMLRSRSSWKRPGGGSVSSRPSWQ